ncbi:MAG: hypothetical protein IKN42_03090 [Elusimicrobia bacterium]|nr:hypothetical protein [Elusimicrobiota bacterium]
MNLLLITLFLIVFSFVANFLPKYKKIFIIVSILFVVSFYFFLEKNFFFKESLCPTREIQHYTFCSNYYNLLVDSFRQHKLNIQTENISHDKGIFYIKSRNDNKDKVLSLLDTSTYKGNLYLYFGITPVLLFYLPFNLITTLYLTDKFLVFFISCLIFLLSLFTVKFCLKKTTVTNNIPPNIIISSIFLIGFCNLLPFILIRSTIYEVAVTTAVLLLFISICLFYYYIYTQNLKTRYILILFISTFLCLSVGARPHYALFIPIFLFFIIFLKYKETTNFKDILRPAIIFIIPCLIYGTIIALYNYLRFDSVFEFGFRYQTNHLDLLDYKLTIKDFIIGLKNNFFLLPSIKADTFFSLTKAYGHRIGNDFVTGVFWMAPVILILFFVPSFFKQIYQKDKKLLIFLLLFITIIFINIIVCCFFGTTIRGIFEFLSLMIILAVIMFLFYINNSDDKLTKNLFNFLFMLIFSFSLFMNMCLLFSLYQDSAFSSTCMNSYTKIIEFLF